MEITEIEISKLGLSEFNVRKNLEVSALDNLANSIKENGLLQPILLKIKKSILENAILYLPNINTQLKIIGVHSRIRNFSLQFDSLKHNLWNHLNNYKELNMYLDSLTLKASPFLNWIDLLPYPLASILWIYKATDNIKEKIDHLLNFFEALSQFLVMLMLSPFVKDREFYIQECGYIKAPYPNWLKKPTFSTWISIGSWLSKTIRRIQNDKNKLNGKGSLIFLESWKKDF